MSKPKMNYQGGKDGIDWAKWSWNPVTGCEHGCPYCYARDIRKHRFNDPQFKPTLYPERLEAPRNTKIPKGKENESGIRNVFTVSMGDLFGDWVPRVWIMQVFNIMLENPQWNFILLTKNPNRYLDFEIEFPPNCWIGATADTQKRADIALGVFYKMVTVKNIKFLSCEPLSEYIWLYKLCFDWLIIGGQSKSSGMPAMQPKWEWVYSLLERAHEFEIPVYFKPNLTVRPKEQP